MKTEVWLLNGSRIVGVGEVTGRDAGNLIATVDGDQYRLLQIETTNERIYATGFCRI